MFAAACVAARSSCRADFSACHFVSGECVARFVVSTELSFTWRASRAAGTRFVKRHDAMKPDSGFDPPPSLAAHPDQDGAGLAARPSSPQHHDDGDGTSVGQRLRNYRKSFRAVPNALKTFFRVLIEETERHR
jgi:hypothetical protein